ncbi:MAG: M1 family metallopeptidase [Clostridia bacterium]|nr:M1 family metallopeptidase [Clostridia bacterium]
MLKKKFLSLFSLVVVLFVFAGCGETNALESASKQGSDYKITATLDYTNKTLSASQNVCYLNNSPNELNEVKFHLYPNAFREDASVYRAVSTTQSSRAYPNGFSEGNIAISKVKVGQNEVDFAITGEDENILSVPLNDVLRSGHSTEISIDFSLTIPNCHHRFGYGEDTLNLGNWYPIACVFESGQFVTDGYSPNGDPFYSDISNYDVTLTYPAILKIASTGEIVENNTSSSQTTTKMTAKAVRDFAIVLSEKFEVISATTGNTTVNYFYYDDENATQHLQTSIDAVNTFNEMIGEYPYKQLNVVKTNFLQGGMEYPNLVYISDDVDVNEEYNNVIIHEIAHQWWYGLVGNNECEYAWIDEGLAEYSTALFYDKNPEYNKTSDQVLSSALSSYLLFCDVYREVYDSFDTSMNRNIHKFNTETEYVYLTYVKGVLMFDSISEMIGQNKMEKVLQNFYENNVFTNVMPSDLIKSFESVAHKKLASYIMSWLDGSVVFEELRG